MYLSIVILSSCGLSTARITYIFMGLLLKPLDLDTNVIYHLAKACGLACQTKEVICGTHPAI